MNKVVQNAFWIIGCKIIKMVLVLCVTMLTARYLGPTNYGVLNYAAGLVAFVTPVMQLGIDSIMVYEFIQHPDEEGKIIGTSMVMNTISALLCMISIAGFTTIVNVGETETIVVCIIYSIALLVKALEMLQYWFQAKLLSKYTAIAMVVAYLLLAILQVVLLIFKLGIYCFSLSYSIEFLVIDILLLFIYKKKGFQKIVFSLETGKRLWKTGKYYIISSMMITIFAQTDKIMLKLMISSEAVGYYSAGVTCAGMTSFVFAAIIDSVRSTVFESKKESQDKFNINMQRLYSIIIFFSLCVSAFICVLAPIAVRILYGKEYDPTVGVLRIIVWYTTFSYLGTVRNIWILAEGKQKYLWMLNMSGAILNVILNIILIPQTGILGAAIASLITQIFTNVIIGFIFKPIRGNNLLMLRACNPKFLIEFIKTNISAKKFVNRKSS